MTEAEKAYAKAERMIAEAKRTGEGELDFVIPETHELADLPPGIADLTVLHSLDLGYTEITDVALERISGLTSLRRLRLSHTQITDAGLDKIGELTNLKVLLLDDTQITDTGLGKLSALNSLSVLSLQNTQITEAGIAQISKMTSLRGLDITNTQVTDLRPLRALTSLLESNPFDGISLTNCAAAKADPRIAEIAAIEDDKTRTQTLFDLIDAGWEPAGQSAAPTADPLLQMGIIGDKLELPVHPPTEAEQAERLKRVLHDRLQTRTNDLATASGNQFPRLTSKARVLLSLVEKPFEQLDLLSIHLELDVLEARRVAGTEEGLPFDEAVMLALEDVTRLGPGLTLDHPEVELMLDRVRRAKTAPIPETEDAARRKLSRAIIANPDANGPNSRAMEERLAEMPDQAAAAILRETKQRNTFVVIGSMAALFAAGRATALGDAVLSEIFSEGIASFLVANWPTILAAAGIYAPWLVATVGIYLVGKGVKQEREKRNQKRPK